MPNLFSKKRSNLPTLLDPLESSYEIFQFRNETRLGELRTLLTEGNVFSAFNGHVDELFLHALRHYDNLHTALLLGATRAVAYEDYYKKIYQRDYILLGIKSVFLRKCDVEKMIYQIHYERHQARHIDDYREYFQRGVGGWTGFSELPDGPDSYLRMTLLILQDRELGDGFYHLPEGETETATGESALAPPLGAGGSPRESCMVLLPRNPLEQWLMTSLFFNDASLKFLEHQQLEFYLKTENKGGWRAMESFRRRLLETMGIKEIHRMMLFSSTILYFLGHRLNNDFDALIYSKSGIESAETNPESEALLALQTRENTPAIEAGSKGPYDFTFKNSPLRKAFFDDYLDEWAQRCGARHFEEMIGNGDRHMYFLGMKSTTIHEDIQRRILRNRPRAIADIISLKKRYSIPNFPAIPAPPRAVKKYCKPGDLSEEEMAKKGGRPFHKYGIEEIEYDEAVNQSEFIRTVQWALKERYHMEFDEQEVMQEMGLTPRRATTTYTIKSRFKEAQEAATKSFLKVKNATTGEITRVKVAPAPAPAPALAPRKEEPSPALAPVPRKKVSAPAPEIVIEEKPVRRLKLKVTRKAEA